MRLMTKDGMNPTDIAFPARELSDWAQTAKPGARKAFWRGPVPIRASESGLSLLRVATKLYLTGIIALPVEDRDGGKAYFAVRL